MPILRHAAAWQRLLVLEHHAAREVQCLQVSLGFSYNVLQNNFGAILEITPSLFPVSRRGGGMLASR